VTKTPKDIGASVRARLLYLSRKRRDDFQLVLTRYANERLLYRLTRSRYQAHFVLKGATLFTLWTGHPHRATRDVDLLGVGRPSQDRLRHIFAEVIALDVGNDGVVFDADSLAVRPIREDQEYGGMRIELFARVTSARVRLQVDVGFGDAITPEPVRMNLPVLLDFPTPHLLVYPRETVVAEKLDAIVQLGMANTRMKDFYDLAVLAARFQFEGALLVRAIRATFTRRKTPLSVALPVGLTSAFATDPSKTMQWAAFVRKSGTGDTGNLRGTVTAIVAFAEAPLAAAVNELSFACHWSPGGPWA
jgi:predicted nucleotidyltransferase component of viral defense system